MPVDPQTVIAALVRAEFARSSHAAVTTARPAPAAPAATTTAWSDPRSPNGMLRLRRALRQTLGLFD
ncbi:hypothetical protein [Streptomyces virginiae]|uniref:hypothetical protein n=1 Tax=Streptomyces virginiae TaxID=1961 RepID=UPI002258560D|nr:hypothetical protein [Streptomyces virginiae]MCX5270057.1 hypothetical protein [Streptomyces virginiae]